MSFDSADDYMLWLLHAAKINAKKARSLLAVFKNAEGVFDAGRYELGGAGLSSREVSSILDTGREESLASMKRQMKRLDMEFISCENPNFPSLLKSIYDYPLGLFYKGILPEDSDLKIAVIGSRECTDYGRNAAYRLSRELAERGVTIVSGMARGIDGTAHKGALEAGGFTVAVAGTGLDICYPSENARLLSKIIENGCAISEYPPETMYQKSHFPQRNRLISGISHGVIVVEAALKSGTNITIEQAIDQGRVIFAVPGNIYSEVSEGTNQLIKDGAVPVTGYEDVLIEYFFGGRNKNILNGKSPFVDNKSKKISPINKEDKKEDKKEGLKIAEGLKTCEKDTSSLDLTQKSVYDCLCLTSALTADEIVNILGISIQELLPALTMLEIQGFAEANAGGKYSRKP